MASSSTLLVRTDDPRPASQRFIAASRKQTLVQVTRAHHHGDPRRLRSPIDCAGNRVTDHAPSGMAERQARSGKISAEGVRTREPPAAGSLPIATFTPPWTLLALIMPKFVVASYIVVTLVFGWRQLGASGAVLSGLIAVGMAPMLLSVFLAPVVDATMGPRRWWTAGVICSLAALGGLIALPFGPGTLTMIGALVFAAYFGGYVSLLAIDVVITATVAPDRKGTANSWLMAGKSLGLAIGGGGGLWLAGHGVTHEVAFAIVTGFTVLCGLTLTFLGADTREVTEKGVAASIRFTLTELLSFGRTATGLRLLAFCMLPIGLGTATELWTIFAGHWHAGGDTIALLQGGPVEVATLAGVVLGGPLGDRAGPLRTFYGLAALNAVLVVVIAIAPAEPAVLLVGALAYAVLFGATQIVSLAVILAMIGDRSGASKLSLSNLALNIPVMVVMAANGPIGDRYGMPMVLIVEAALTVASLFAAWLIFRDRAIGEREAHIDQTVFSRPPLPNA